MISLSPLISFQPLSSILIKTKIWQNLQSFILDSLAKIALMNREIREARFSKNRWMEIASLERLWTIERASWWREACSAGTETCPRNLKSKLKGCLQIFQIAPLRWFRGEGGGCLSGETVERKWMIFKRHIPEDIHRELIVNL